MIPFTVYALEGVRTELTLLCFKPWRIDLQVFFTILCFLLLVLRFVWSIVFDTPGTMYLASYSQVPLLSTVLILRDFRVYIDIIHSDNKLSDIETTVND